MVIAEYYDGIRWKACTNVYCFENTLEAITNLTKWGWKSRDNYITVEPEISRNDILSNIGSTFCHKYYPLLLLRLKYKSVGKINWIKEGF